MIDTLLALDPSVRYVATYRDSHLEMRMRTGLTNESAAESDRYEELLVNPTLLALTRQRGAIDCGGLEFLIIRYGNFFGLVYPLTDGHLSVAVEPEGDPLDIASRIKAVTERL